METGKLFSHSTNHPLRDLQPPLFSNCIYPSLLTHVTRPQIDLTERECERSFIEPPFIGFGILRRPSEHRPQPSVLIVEPAPQIHEHVLVAVEPAPINHTFPTVLKQTCG